MTSNLQEKRGYEITPINIEYRGIDFYEDFNSQTQSANDACGGCLTAACENAFFLAKKTCDAISYIKLLFNNHYNSQDKKSCK